MTDDCHKHKIEYVGALLPVGQGCILKSNIVNPGKKCPVPYSVDEIAQVRGALSSARELTGCHPQLRS